MRCLLIWMAMVMRISSAVVKAGRGRCIFTGRPVMIHSGKCYRGALGGAGYGWKTILDVCSAVVGR